MALRHILQQVVENTDTDNQKNTDMMLAHDGYIQRLSWHFECDKCYYKSFYSHDIESHSKGCTGMGRVLEHMTIPMTCKSLRLL